MYKGIKIFKAARTSFIDLINLDTGTVEHVFDDSSVVNIGNADFSFMQEGGVYDCKMELFGDFDKTKTNKNIEISIISSDVVIGKTNYFKAIIDSDIYYILKSDAKDFKVKKCIIISPAKI